MMDLDAVADLLDFVSAAAPQQRLPDEALDAWFVLLHDIPFEDARLAAAQVLARQPFVAPAEIRAAVEAIQAARVQAVGPMPVPQVDPDDLAAYRAEGQAVLRRVLSGQWGRAELAAYERAGRSITGARALYVNPAVSTSRPALPAGFDLTRSA